MLNIENKSLMKPSFIKLAFSSILSFALFLGIGIVCNVSYTLVPFNVFNWIPEILIFAVVVLYFLLGVVLNAKKINVIRFLKYRVWGSVLLSLVLFDVGLRNSVIGEDQNAMLVYVLSIGISIMMMLRIQKKTMANMEKARSKGWLKKKFDEEKWIWDIAIFVDYDGPTLERVRMGRLRVWDKLHYITPAIGSVISNILGITGAYNFIGLIFIYVGILVISATAQNIGEIKQLLIWESQEGRELSTVE